MAASGLTRNDFVDVRESSFVKQNAAFCANQLDAIVYSLGHPNGLIRDATVTCHGMLAAVGGLDIIDRMLAEYEECERAVIPGGTHPANPADVHTFRVCAVAVTPKRIFDTVVYEVVGAVFDNFDGLQRLRPAFEALSVAKTVLTTGRAPVHAEAARYYRERDRLP